MNNKVAATEAVKRNMHQ